MQNKSISLIILFFLCACANRNGQTYATNSAYTAEPSQRYEQTMARTRMDTTVCIAKANAAVPGAGDLLDAQTLRDRLRVIEWSKLVEGCSREKGLPYHDYSYPSLDDMKRCERDGKNEMPNAKRAEQSAYLESCLEVQGFTFPWYH